MTIAIIDDHILLAETLANVLQQYLGQSEVRVFKNGEDFLQAQPGSWAPDIVFLDVRLPGTTGIELTDKILQHYAFKCQIIMLSSITDGHTVKTALQEGASAYLSKDTPIEEVLLAIETVQKGEKYIAKSLKDSFIKYMISDNDDYIKLSGREKDILKKICDGRTPKEIASDTGLSLNTVQGYLKTVMRKFKVNRTADLILLAIEKGYYNIEVKKN